MVRKPMLNARKTNFPGRFPFHTLVTVAESMKPKGITLCFTKAYQIEAIGRYSIPGKIQSREKDPEAGMAPAYHSDSDPDEPLREPQPDPVPRVDVHVSLAQPEQLPSVGVAGLFQFKGDSAWIVGAVLVVLILWFLFR